MKKILIVLFTTFHSLFSNAQYNSYTTDTTSRLANQTSNIIEVMERKKNIEVVINNNKPIILLQGNDSVALAQSIALSSKDFCKYFIDESSKKKTLSEIFGVYKMLKSNSRFKASSDAFLYRVEMYNYAYNASTVAIVDITNKKIINVEHYFQTQPDVPKQLGDIALKIAIASPEVKAALGFTPTLDQGQMYYTPTALNYSRCERSKHLCIAPTFVVGQKALWAVVDLTDLKLVGVRWTNLGRDSIPTEMATEKKIQNEYITNCFCLKENTINQDGWKLNYSITASDGLRISAVNFNDVPVLSSAKLVDWHVSYSNTDGFGYSDAIGCPEFSHGAVLAIEPPVVSDLIIDGSKAGFVLEQKFYSKGWPNPCNYNYVQRFEFYSDGSFRVACGSLGRGCGNNGTYRPVMRIAFASNKNNFIEKNATINKAWKKENWKQITSQDIKFSINDKNNFGYEMLPDLGRFSTNNISDNPYIYITKNKPNADEGESDLVTIGPCCNTDYKQGPEKFIEPIPDNIENTSLVLWYVPVLKNDDTPGKENCWAKAALINGTYQTTTYPCIAGPKFIPLKNKR